MKNQDYRLHTQRKNNQSLSSVSSGIPVSGIFESRPFVVQQKQQENSQQPDLKASLKGADRYGHHLARMKPAGISTGRQILAKETIGASQQQSMQQSMQQAQGRVQPTMQMMDGVPVNDDKGVEHEADEMGGRRCITPC